MDKENTSEMERRFRKRKAIDYALDKLFPDESSVRQSSSDSPYTGPRMKVARIQQVKEEELTEFKLEEEEEAEEEELSEFTLKEEEEEELTKFKSEQEEELTEYELERQKNIEERKRLMRELGIEEAKEDLKKVTALVNKGYKVPNKNPVKRSKKVIYPPPREKSLRLQGKSPTGELLADKPQPISLTSTTVLLDRLTGPLPMKSSLNSTHTEEVLGSLVDSIKFTVKEEKEKRALTKELESFKKELQKLTLREENVRKMVPNRIFSIAIHPVEDKLVLAAGDKWGNIGLCDFSIDKDKGMQCFQAHTGPVNCISFPSYDLTKMFSTSYDGTTRSGDLNKLIFEEVYASKETMSGNHTTWHTLLDENKMLIAHGSGDAALIDQRSNKSVEGWYDCHARSIRTIQRHPVRDDYFMTSSGVGEVKVWDLRFIRRFAPDSVCNMVHPKGLSAAFFSFRGTYTVTTCNDDRLRVFNMSNMEVMRPNVTSYALHNNHTGRWLTTFKAMWHPQREDMFIVGSMEHPRKIAMYSEKCRRLLNLESENLNSVNSICCFHPTQNIVVGGNSSGKVHVFV